MPRLSENKRLQKEAKELRELLAEFGATLRGWDPGVSANVQRLDKDHPGARGNGFWGEHLSFSHIEWEWLRPLLEELRELRRQKRKEAGRKKK